MVNVRGIAPHGTGARTLALWANGVRVGDWTVPSRGPQQLQYDPAWAESRRGRPISLSLPFNPINAPLTGPAVQAYFDNLLPDNEVIRRRVASRFKLNSLDTFDLLAAVGRDCVGALQILPQRQEPSQPHQVDFVRLNEEEIEAHLNRVLAVPGPADAAEDEDDFRISLAGAQEKTALLWHDGQWCKPRGATPTTHIVKLPLGFIGARQLDFSTSVDNEWLCLRILKEFGMPVANAEIATFGKHRVLVVERFDRLKTSDGLLRLPQEDFCQATATPPHKKYEAEGGPGVIKIAEILRNSISSEADLNRLLEAQFLFWLLRAPDGHAKNFSMHIRPGGAYQMAPLYDVMSAYPVMGNGPNPWSPFELKLAMAVIGKSRHYKMNEIKVRHFISTGKLMGLGDLATEVIQAVIAAVPTVIAKVQKDLPQGFNQAVSESILGGLKRAVEGLPVLD